VGWLDSLARLKNFYAVALTTSLPGVDTSQPVKGIHVYSAVRLQSIKACCFASSKTCAAAIEKPGTQKLIECRALFHAH